MSVRTGTALGTSCSASAPKRDSLVPDRPQRGEPAALTTVCLSYCHTGAVWVSGNPQLPQAAAAALQGAARVAGHHGVVREAPSVKRMAAREEPSVQVLSQGG